MKPRHRPSAFTLFELLVSVTLIVTVVGIVYGSVMTASKTSTKTTQRLSQVQRGAFALDHISGLWHCLYIPSYQPLPTDYQPAVEDGDLLRFVSLSPWEHSQACMPLWNRLRVQQGQLILQQALLSPDLTDILQEAKPQVLLEDINQVSIKILSMGQDTPMAIRLTLNHSASYRQSLVMTAATREVRP